jgi:hypothetical protein
MHYILHTPKNEEGAYGGYKIGPEKYARWEMFYNGVGVGKPLPRLFLELHETSGSVFYDALPNVGKGLIINEKFLNTLQGAGVRNIEAFPIDIIDSNGTKHEYFLINVVGVIDAFDKENSTIVDIPRDYNRVLTKLALDENNIANFNRDRKTSDRLTMFRISTYTPYFIVVAPEVRAAIEKAGITGVTFLNPEDAGENL